MRKKVLLVFLAMVLVVSLVAFGACKAEEEEPPPPPPPPVEEEEEPPPPPPPPPWEWPELLAALTMPVGSMGYGTMVAWTAVMQEDTGMQIRLVPAGASSAENFQNLKDGPYVWHMDAPSQIGGLLEGIGGYASRDLGPFQIRGLWPSYESVTGYLVRGDSDIKTPRDIKPGTKIAYLAGSPMGKLPMDALVAWSGVDPNDIEWLPFTGFWDSLDMVRDGSADVTWTFPTAPQVFEAAASPSGIAFIDLDVEADPEGGERFLSVWPTIAFGVNQLGVPESIGNNGLLQITGHYAVADSDPELIYQICKWLWENYDSYKDLSPTLTYHHIDTVMKMVETDFVPPHEGLVRYLKELGKWTPAHEARYQANVDLITRYVEAYKTAITMAEEQQIDVGPKNEEWIALWENYKKELALPLFTMFLGVD
ncbi:MAG TPA: ABC transporter substrate-binding protein [Dehalococcoidia bacterium]|nr:ABC transporter substrate-binding protein [Dehalococcoidia bacterium]